MNASSNPGHALPLAGIRVVEFTHMVMGPTCGMILADLGAEVIKVEPPGGDKTRQLPGLGIGFFRAFNRNKKSIVLDLHTPAGHASALELIGDCDVVLENFRPGLMTSLGLDHASLAAKFPRLIYVSHKGFLPGPLRKAAGARRGGADDGRPVVHDRAEGPAAARRHVGERHHGRHVRRHRRARRAARARHDRPRPGSAERAVRELRLPLVAAHAAVLDDRRADPADAVARLGLERLRRVHARRRRAALHRRRQRQAVPHLVPRARRARAGRRAGLRQQRLARRGAARAAAPARRDPEPASHRRAVAEAREPREFRMLRSCDPNSSSTTRTCARAAASCRCRPTTAARPTWCCCR